MSAKHRGLMAGPRLVKLAGLAAYLMAKGFEIDPVVPLVRGLDPKRCAAVWYRFRDPIPRAAVLAYTTNGLVGVIDYEQARARLIGFSKALSPLPDYKAPLTARLGELVS